MKELEQLVEINEESCMRIARNAVRAFEREIDRIKEAVKNNNFDAVNAIDSVKASADKYASAMRVSISMAIAYRNAITIIKTNQNQQEKNNAV